MSTGLVYLSGVLTVPAAAVAFLLARELLVVITDALARRGWFVETGTVIDTGLSTRGLVSTRRLCGVTFGRFQPRERWWMPGSRWVHVARLCVGRKDSTLIITEDEYTQLRAAAQSAETPPSRPRSTS